MTKTSKAWLMIALSLLAALGTVLLASTWMSRPAQLSLNRIAVANSDINPGTRLTADMLRLVEWPADSIPAGSFTDMKKLDSRVARVSFVRGEPIVEARLAVPGAAGGLSAVVAEGKRAMTVRVNDVIGVAGFALPGNFVDILVSTQNEAHARDDSPQPRGEQRISKLVLERILVLAIAQESSQNDMRPKVVNAVTLEVSPEQAEKLDLARNVGELALVLRNQVDVTPALTEGATKQSLLQQPVAPAKPAVQVKAPVRKVVAKPQTCQDIITGAGRFTECF
jgi:pilus assembly protein CpaB